MNINDTPGQACFRARVRGWIATHVPNSLKGLRQGVVQGPGLPAARLGPLQEALRREGWLLPSFPKEHGGGGLDTSETIILTKELAAAGVPVMDARGGAGGGPNNISQILLKWGTPAQKERWLYPTWRGEITWCQGYSEPGAGSDLAGLRSKAEVVEGGFLLNGQKIWTSRGHRADWIFMLVRTDPDARRKQEGISVLIFDMKTPGITVRPITTIDGFHHFNEVFCENVWVPASGLVGEMNKGWDVAKALLVHERLNIAESNPVFIGRAIGNLKAAALATAQERGTAWDDPGLRRRVVELEMDADCLRFTRYRSLTQIAKGETPGNETMIFKSCGCELFQRVVELHQLVVGPAGVIWNNDLFGDDAGEIAQHGANIRASTIRGGTSEIQRNIVAKRVLGLPD